MNREIWHFSISSYAGIVGSATHLFGRLRGPESGEYDVEREMTPREVLDLNRREGFTVCEVGAKTKSFPSNDGGMQLRAAARNLFDKVAPSDAILLEGNRACCDPMPMLTAGGDAEIMNEAEEIWWCWVEIDGWEKRENRQQAEALAVRWDALMERIKAGASFPNG